jgi:3-deoxy-7-phosphoheptulonate synthase
MIVSLEHEADADVVRRALAAKGLWVAAVERAHAGGAVHLVIAPYSAAVDAAEVARIPGVRTVSMEDSRHPRVDAQGPVVEAGGARIGTGRPVFMCGPCSVESEEQIASLAARLSPMGVAFLRGGAFKPRTSPYAFQGHGEVALRWLRRAADAHGMRVVTEALSEGDAAVVAEYADLVQVGSRNMGNYALLKAVGRTGRPVLLKRAMAATVDEWLLAGEYLLVHGAKGVVFCERGIRGFDGVTRNLLDLGAVALLAHVHRLPVIVDPSHASGRRDLILPLARAALAAGAAGVMIETHEDPGRALSDGPQALVPDQLREVLATLAGGAA